MCLFLCLALLLTYFYLSLGLCNVESKFIECVKSLYIFYVVSTPYRYLCLLSTNGKKHFI